MSEKSILSKVTEKKVGRREFLKSSAFLGGCAALAAQIDWVFSTLAKAPEHGLDVGDYAYELAEAENIIYSTCLQCHLACQIKGKVLNGVLVKLDGSPYSPQNMMPHLPYSTSPFKAAKIDGKLCPKGQAGIQTVYDPYRLRKVLKRVGPRGSNQWKAIPFDQAIEEIVNGGQLFIEAGETRHVEGLAQVFALRDPKIAKAMAEDVAKMRQRQLTAEAFRNRHREHLDLLIDPAHPDLGPKNNQFVFLAGRIEHGRKELAKRFTHGAFGSVNFYEHTTICEQSHHIAFIQMTNQYADGKWSGGKEHMKPDLMSTEFVIFWGTGAFEANFGLTSMAERVTEGVVDRGLKVAVIDPRLSKTAGKAKWWVPIKPGTDAALALAMIRWILEHERYDRTYLENANKAAAAEDGEPTWTNATHLVKIENGRPAAFLRASEVGIGSEHQFVVSRGGKLIAVDPNDSARAVEGDLFVETRAGGYTLKSAFQLIREEAFARSLEEYSRITGVDPDMVVKLAREFTAHGKKAAIDFYRGPVQHTNGFYNAQAIITLNLLIGNPDWRGGLSAGGGHWHEDGSKQNPYPINKLHPGKLTAFGPPVSREKWKYEECSLYERDGGYPARRTWYPFSSNVYQEVIPSAAEGYPYPIKVLYLHKGTPVLSTPAGHAMIEILKDTEKIPLFIASDIVIGETSMYADYIFPDVTYLERWGTPHVTPDVNTRTSKVRQPIVPPIPEIVEVDGEEMPISMEAFLIAVAKRLGLSGFGKDGFGKGMNFDRPEDFYLKLVANIALGDTPGDAVPDATDEEMELFLKARRHLPAAVFDPEKLRRAVRPEEWRKVVTVLCRGGRFEDAEGTYDGDYLAHRFGKMFSLYIEPVATTRNSITGRYFSGVPHYEPASHSDGTLVEDENYPFQLITFKEAFGGHSRTISNYWSNVALQPANKVIMNRHDAERLGLKSGDWVKLVSASNPQGHIEIGKGDVRTVSGEVHAVEGMAPGVVAVSWHYGHWAYGGREVVVDGEVIPGDPRRLKGLCPNPVMLLDKKMKNVCLSDPIGGSASFYDTRVQVVKTTRSSIVA